MFTRSSALYWVLISLSLFTLSACDSTPSAESDSDQPSSSFTLPRAIVQSKLSDTGAIAAYIQVDDGPRQTMSVGSSSASIQFFGLSTGSHKFTIILEYASASDTQNTITLVESSKTVNISSGGNNLSFAEADFKFSLFDDDKDGISNLDEMRSGHTAPIVTSLSPLDGATAVLESTSITATFDDPIISSTLDSTSFSVTGESSGTVSGSVTFDTASKIASFTPASVLNFNETYTARLTTAVQNSASIALASELSWSFTIKQPPVLQVSNLSTLGESASPILAFNSVGDGMAVWQGNSLKYSVYDSGSGIWSAEAVLTSNLYSTPSLVSNGTGFAVVWEQYEETGYYLFGSFFDGASWSQPVKISTDRTYLRNGGVKLVSNGTGYGLTWSQELNGVDRIFASISNDAASWSPVTVIDNAATSSSYPKISSNGSGYAVIWLEGGHISVNTYNGSWSSANGIVIDDPNTTGAWNYDIATNGSSFTSVWSKGGRILSRTFTIPHNLEEIQQIEGSMICALGDQSIASNGSGYAVVFSCYNGVAHDVYGAVTSSSIGPTGWNLPVLLEMETADISGYPVIASDGNRYAALWSQYDGSSIYDLFSSVYDGNSWSSGAAIESASDSITSGYSLVGSVSDSQFVVTWTQQVSDTKNAYAAVNQATGWGLAESLETSSLNVTTPNIKVNPTGGVSVAWGQSVEGAFVNTFDGSIWGGETALTSSPTGTGSYLPKLFSNGYGKTLALWVQASGSLEGLYANIYENGSWGQPKLLDESIWSSEFHAATDGDGFAVVWSNAQSSYRVVYASIYNGTNWSGATQVDSMISGDADIAYSFEGSPIASNGNGYMLTYAQGDGIGYIDIYAREYDGMNWGTPRVLDLPSINFSAHKSPVIATNGTSYLVAWVQNVGTDPNYDGTDAFSSEFDGVDWSTAELIVDGGATNYIDSYVVDLVSNGTDYLAVWTQEDANAYSRAMANIYSSSSWGAPVVLDAGLPNHNVYRKPRAVSNGNGYAVAWKEDAEDAGLNRFVGANVYDGSKWVGPTSFDDGSTDYLDFSTLSDNLITTDGNNYAVIWSRENSTGVANLFANVYDGSWSAISEIETGAGAVSDFNIASDGSGFLVSWLQDIGDGAINILGNNYDSSAGWSGESVLDSDTSSSAFELSLTGSSNGYMAIWIQAEPDGEPGTLYPWARVGF